MTAQAPTSNRMTLYRDAGSRFGGAAKRAWGKKWVRILAYLAAIPLLLYVLLWLVFARGLPSADTLLSYQPPLPTNIRDSDGQPVQSFARERRVVLSYDEFPQQLIDAFTSAEVKASTSTCGYSSNASSTRRSRAKACTGSPLMSRTWAGSGGW